MSLYRFRERLSGFGQGAAEANRTSAGLVSSRWAFLAGSAGVKFGIIVGIVAGLIVLKLVLYIVLAQPFGGAEQGLCRWDCRWYTHTIANGYDLEPNLQPTRDLANWAFFPLFPMLARGVMTIAGLSPFWSGTLIAAICFGAFAVLSCWYRALTRGSASRDGPWLLLLAAYPFSLYFFIPYSESAYLLCTILLLLAAEARNAVSVAIATVLLAATRPTGVLAIPYLLVERAAYARQALRQGLWRKDPTRTFADIAFPLAVAPLGLAGYMAYLWWLTGDALAFSHVQLAWGRVPLTPLQSLKTYYWAVTENDWAKLFRADFAEIVAPRAYLAAAALPAAAACAWLLARKRVLECWLLGGTVVLALTTGVLSLPRFVYANPVFLLVIGDMVDLIRSRAVRIGLAVLCIGIQLLLVLTWLHNSSLLA